MKIKICTTIILSVVLCGCETWSLTSREEGRPWVFENRVLRRIFVPRRDEVTGEWGKLTLVHSVMNLQVPYNAGNILTS
jgi:hypothetical protein